jgi:hypothetical protein
MGFGLQGADPRSVKAIHLPRAIHGKVPCLIFFKGEGIIFLFNILFGNYGPFATTQVCYRTSIRKLNGR